jgi:aquaporin Z
MNRYLTEFTGTFFLVLTIGLTAISGSEMAPLAIGASLMVMVYMGGHISGAHYNPAVSLAVMLRGTLTSRELVPYVVSQLAGAIVASFAVYVMFGRTFMPAPLDPKWVSGPLLIEILYTTALALVVLNVATVPATAGNSFYGLAIGFTVVVAAFAGGTTSGGAFNPSVGLGPAVVHAIFGEGSIGHVWLYVVGPCVGAAIAAAIFKVQHSPPPAKPTTEPARA